MLRRVLAGTSVLAVLLATGCAGVQPLVLPWNAGPSAAAPAGPKVATLMANLKCELYRAVNSQEPLTAYQDAQSLALRPSSVDPHLSSDRQFTLQNIFKQIEYVADAYFTLDVTGTSGINPTASFTQPYRSALGVLPATSAVLSVGGTLSESSHRYIQLYTSVDFSRLLASEPNSMTAEDREPRIARYLETACPHGPTGTELEGSLDLKQTLALGIMESAMNDVSLQPDTSATAASTGPGAPPTANGGQSQYTFGLISAQIDFTIVQGINGGPNWNLAYFKGPGGGSQGLLNFSRTVLDKLNIAFVPVCVRQHYWFDPRDKNPNHQYFPEPNVATPFWANFLPPCSSPNHLALQRSALAAARYVNDVNRLSNAVLLTPGTQLTQ
jgi:hypothetical protein